MRAPSRPPDRLVPPLAGCYDAGPAGWALAMTATETLVVSGVLSELETWRAEHPGATLEEQRAAFPMPSLRRRVDAACPGGEFDFALYRRLLAVAGYGRAAAAMAGTA